MMKPVTIFLFKVFFFLMSVLSFFVWYVYLFFLTSTLFQFNLFNELMLSVSIPIILDWMGLSVILLVNVITFCVFGFSLCYLGNEDKKLCLLISSFVVGMWIICLVPSLASMMIGWDILGMVSYKLIIHYPSEKSVSAGNFTVFSNRVGDAALILAVGFLFMEGNCLWLQSCDNPKVVFLIIIAALTKSAGYPFMAWLPEAMAAPTPVSALVHSSTLVTAGILLLSRFVFLVQTYSEVLIYLGMFVCWLSGMCAMFEWDIKKVVALSTLSQLGIMLLALGINCPEMAFFHLCTHACFKSLLFISVGVFIKYNGHVQDLRHIGSLFKDSIFSSSCMMVSLSSLIGVPFLSGFYSKDMIYDKLVSMNLGFFSFVCLIFSVGLSSGYSLKLFKVLLSSTFFSVISLKNFKEPKFEMGLLTVLSIFFGGFFFSVFSVEVDESFISFYVKMFGSFVWVFGVLYVYFFSFMKMSVYFSSLGMLSFLSKQPLISFWVYLNKKFLKLMDHGFTESFLGQGQDTVLSYFLNQHQKWQKEEWSKSFFCVGRTFFFIALISFFLK